MDFIRAFRCGVLVPYLKKHAPSETSDYYVEDETGGSAPASPHE